MTKRVTTSSLAHLNLTSHEERKMKKDVQRLGLALVVTSLAIITGCEQKNNNNGKNSMYKKNQMQQHDNGCNNMDNNSNDSSCSNGCN